MTGLQCTSCGDFPPRAEKESPHFKAGACSRCTDKHACCQQCGFHGEAFTGDLCGVCKHLSHAKIDNPSKPEGNKIIDLTNSSDTVEADEAELVAAKKNPYRQHDKELHQRSMARIGIGLKRSMFGATTGSAGPSGAELDDANRLARDLGGYCKVTWNIRAKHDHGKKPGRLGGVPGDHSANYPLNQEIGPFVIGLLRKIHALDYFKDEPDFYPDELTLTWENYTNVSNFSSSMTIKDLHEEAVTSNAKGTKGGSRKYGSTSTSNVNKKAKSTGPQQREMRLEVTLDYLARDERLQKPNELDLDSSPDRSFKGKKRGPRTADHYVKRPKMEIKEELISAFATTSLKPLSATPVCKISLGTMSAFVHNKQTGEVLFEADDQHLLLRTDGEIIKKGTMRAVIKAIDINKPDQAFALIRYFRTSETDNGVDAHTQEHNLRADIARHHRLDWSVEAFNQKIATGFLASYGRLSVPKTFLGEVLEWSGNEEIARGDFFMVMPWFDLKERKFSGSKKATNHEDELGKLVNTFSHWAVFHHGGALAFTDLQGWVKSAPGSPPEIYLFDIMTSTYSNRLNVEACVVGDQNEEGLEELLSSHDCAANLCGPMRLAAWTRICKMAEAVKEREAISVALTGKEKSKSKGKGKEKQLTLE